MSTTTTTTIFVDITPTDFADGVLLSLVLGMFFGLIIYFIKTNFKN
ncbi:MAG: hypothetical protein PHS54_06240 [Clostridia bacterium]|nr:hypothetical protein [Clostridia bacterium]